MIGYLKGRVLSAGEETALIDVQGVGYEIQATPRLLSHLRPGEGAALFIDTVVREDFIRLYGFTEAGERQCFRVLQTVQGVGAKAAISILNIMTPGDLADAVALEDVTAVSRAQGIGKKIATRIITELKPKLGDLTTIRTPVATGDEAPVPRVVSINETPGVEEDDGRADAVSALTNLGYDAIEARKTIARIAREMPEAGVEELIRHALKALAA